MEPLQRADSQSLRYTSTNLNTTQLRRQLNAQYERYNRPEFIKNDPIQIPHRFIQRQDIEIAALFAALLAWGQRPTIINKCNELLRRMDDAPHQFITQHQDEDLKKLLGFCHRTFCDTDLLYFVHFLRHWYGQHDTLETAFLVGHSQRERLINFHNHFFSLPDAPPHTRKHVATPVRKSADSQGHACGKCDSCRLRREGFAKAGISDPTRYAA